MNKSKKLRNSVIIIGILLVMIISIKLSLVCIQISRFLFWFDVVLIPLSFIGIIVSIICLSKRGWNDEKWLKIGGIILIAFLFTFFTINCFYNKGYSDEAIEKKADLEEQLEDYKLILRVYTGTFKLTIEGMVADQVNEALCESLPDIPCEQVKESYDSYKKLIGWKNCADKIVKIWR